MQKLNPQFYKSVASGMITNVNKNLMPKDSAALLLNVDVDEELGSPVTRLGTGIVGTQMVAGMRVLGLSDFRDADGSNHALVAAINASGGATSVVYKVGTGTIRTGLTASKKMRFLTFLDSILMINGADAEASYDGSSVITTGGAFDLANVPGSNLNSICLEWLDRVYLAGDTANPDRLYFSSTPVSGAVSWTSGNGYVDIEPEDGGGSITGLGKVPGYILIFKERSLKRWNFDSAFPETLIQIGTPSHESIVNQGGVCAFFSASSKNARGFYITNGERPISISHDRVRNIKKWIDAIPQASEANIAGWGDARAFWWSVGDLTVDGRSFTNVVLRWNKVLDQWSVRSYPSEFTVFASYVTSGTNAVVAGDDDGQVIQIDKDSTYTDYNAKPINYEILYQEEDFGYNEIKDIHERVVVNAVDMNGGAMEMYADGVLSSSGKIKGRVSEMKIDTTSANVFQFGVRGSVLGKRGILKEMEIPNVVVTDNYTK
jgi:hypothetical protein